MNDQQAGIHRNRNVLVSKTPSSYIKHKRNRSMPETQCQCTYKKKVLPFITTGLLLFNL